MATQDNSIGGRIGRGLSRFGIGDVTPGYNLRLGGGTTPYLEKNPPPAPDPIAKINERSRGIKKLSPMKGIDTGNVLGTRNYSGSGSSAKADPYEKYGGREAFDRLQSSFNTKRGNIGKTAGEAAGLRAGKRKSSILDFIQDLSGGQRAIDESAVQNELAKRQGTLGVQDFVDQGISSSRAQLANRNALDSSAREQFGRAFGELGRRQLSDVGQEFELGRRNIGLEQEDLGRQKATGLRKFEEEKSQVVNTIVAEARNSLAALDAEIQAADLPTRIEIEREKNRIKDDVLGKLSQFDEMLRQRAGGVQPTSDEERRRQAFELSNRGIAPEDPFQIDTEAPIGGAGPAPLDLPLFLRPPDDDEVR